MTRSLETRGTTAEDAVRRALVLLRVARQDVEVEVLDPGRRGLLRGRPATVRVTVKGEHAAGGAAASGDAGDTNPPPPETAADGQQSPAGPGGSVRSGDVGGRQSPAGPRSPSQDDVDGGAEADPASGPATAGEPARDRSPRAARQPVIEDTNPTEDPEEDPVSDIETETSVDETETSVDEAAGKPDDELTDEEFMELLDRDADLAADFIEGLLDLLDLPGDIEIVTEEQQAFVTVQDVGSGLLIGRRGATLDALQELVRCAIQRQTERRTHVRVDVEGYRARQLDKLRDKCREAIAEVRESGEPAKLEPMDAYERKMMHDLVAKTGGVTSSSEGNEPRRRVVIHPAD